MQEEAARSLYDIGDELKMVSRRLTYANREFMELMHVYERCTESEQRLMATCRKILNIMESLNDH